MADKVLNDPSVSRRHAKLALSDDALTIEDLKSAYGTKVNGQALEPFQPTIVSPGDTVVIGAVTLEVKRG
jgi:pSer/pThr/pTyr-binding forkhead associated (FHA) protein